MAAGVQTAASNQLDTIISQFNLQVQELGTLKPLATNLKLRPHEGTGKNVDMWQVLAAYSLTDGIDMSQAQALATTQTTYTPAEIGVQVVVADTMIRRVADASLLQNVGNLMAHAYAKKEDADGCAQSTSFTSQLGGSTTVFSPGHAMAADTRLRMGNSLTTPEPAPDPIYGVFHPCTLLAVVGRIIPLATTPAGATAYGVAAGAHLGVSTSVGRQDSAMSEQLLREGSGALGMLAGFKVYRDANFVVTSNAADSMVFSKEGLIYVNEIEPNTSRQRDESLRATELNTVGSYIWGVYRAAAYGIDCLFDAALPTS